MATRRTFPGVAFAACLSFSLWFLPSVAALHKFLSPTRGLVVCIVAGALILWGVWVVARGGPSWSALRRWWPVWVVGLVPPALLPFLYRLSHSGALGQGSDRADALNVGIRALLHGAYPYYGRTFLGGVISPMPGAFLLAFPFYVLGNAAIQNAFWSLAFVWLLTRLCTKPISAIFCFSVFFLACPAIMQDYVTGGDYTINAIYVLIAFYLLAECHLRAHARWMSVTCTLFFAIALCSRPTYALALVPVMSALIYQKSGARPLWIFLVSTAATAGILVGPFYFYDPVNFTPLAAPRFMLHGLPTSLHLNVLVPLLTVLIASISFVKKMDTLSAVGFAAAGLAVAYLPLCLVSLVSQGLNVTTLAFLYYSVPVTTFGGVWLTGRLTRAVNLPQEN